jgi:hypothetical protein
VRYLDTEAVSNGYAPCYEFYYHRDPLEGTRAFADLGRIGRGDDTAGQTGSVSRSNYRSLMRDYPDIWTPVSYSNVDALGAFVSDLPDEVIDILTGLADQHPIYDEDDMSALESEEIAESWDQYVRSDLTSEIYRVHPDEGDAWDALTSDQQRDMFWSAVEATDSYPEHSGLDVVWRYDAIVTELAERLNVSVQS